MFIAQFGVKLAWLALSVWNIVGGELITLQIKKNNGTGHS